MGKKKKDTVRSAMVAFGNMFSEESITLVYVSDSRGLIIGVDGERDGTIGITKPIDTPGNAFAATIMILLSNGFAPNPLAIQQTIRTIANAGMLSEEPKNETENENPANVMDRAIDEFLKDVQARAEQENTSD